MAETNNTKQAAWIALGSFFSTCFGIISSMILSRYFDKIEYGTYKQVLYIYQTLLAMFTLSLPKAYSYFLPKAPLDQAKSLISKITKLFFILGGILSILLFFCAPYFAQWLKNPDLVTPLRIFSPVPFLMLPTMGLEGIMSTYRCTKFLAIYNIITRCVMLFCVALPVMIWNLDCNSAIVGFVIGSLVAFLLAIYFKYYPVKNSGNTKSTNTYYEIFAFCLPLFFATIWGTIINSTSQFFISRYFGTEVFAVYSNGAMELPFVGMITASTSTVLTPLFTRYLHEKRDIVSSIVPVWNNAFAKSAMIIYPMTVFFIFTATPIMSVMYGQQYAASGTYFQISLVSYFAKVIVFYSIILALGATQFYQKVFMFWAIIMGLTDVMIVQLCPNPYFIAANFSLWQILSCVIMIVYISKRLGVRIMTLIPIKVISKIFVISFLSVVPMYIFQMYVSEMLSGLILLIGQAIIYTTFVMILSFVFNIKYWSIVKPLFVR